VRTKLDTKDLWLVFSAGVVGMALTFVLVSSTSSYKKAAIVAGGVSLSAFGLAVWRHFRAHEVVLLRDNVLVAFESGADIVFAPDEALLHPKLFLSSHGRPVVVEQIWRDGQPTLTGPTAITKWRQGVVYEGYLDASRPIKIRVRNEGFSPAVVHASIAAIKE
jgi:hypothetical protein